MSINVKWFQDRIRDIGLSQRKISVQIANNPNTMSLILSGKRRVTHKELPTIARLLDTTSEEVLKHLGTQPAATTRTKEVPVIGIVDETGRVLKSSMRTVEAPGLDGAKNFKAVIYKMTGRGAAWMHGWTLYFAEPARARDGVDVASLDRLSVCEVGDAEGRYIGVVQRALDRGFFDLLNMATGEPIVSSATIRSAHPVQWIRAA